MTTMPAAATGFDLVLPFYNEAAGAAETVTALATALAAAGADYHLVLVDNGSRDGTGALLARLAAANPRLRVVTVPVNRGYGHGIRAGLDACTAPVAGWLDGDGQVAPADVLRVWRALGQGDTDIAKARRMTRGDTRTRRFVSQVFNIMFRWLFGIESFDLNAKPKFFHTRLLRDLRLVSDDWFIDTELMIKAARLGLRLVTVDVHFLTRPAGASHVRLATIREFLVNLIRYRCGGPLRAWEKERQRCR